MPMVEAAGVARRLGRPAVEEDRRGGRQGSSMVTTTLEVDASGAAQKLSRPAMEGDRRGERRLARPTGEVAGRRPPRNRATSERCRSSGRGREATRCSRRCREGRWWCCYRSHHRCGFRCYRAAAVGAAFVASGRRRRPAAIGGSGAAHRGEAQLTREAAQSREGGATDP
jgi:hypothetical protein